MKIPILVSKIVAFLRRDFLLHSSYKLSFFFEIGGIFMYTAMFYFIDKLFGFQVNPQLKQYGGDYFAFVLIGTAFFNYSQVSLKSFSGVLRQGQIMGTLTSMLVTPTRAPTLIILSSIYDYLYATVKVLIYLVFGILVFEMKVSNPNYLSVCLLLVLTIVSFSALGILSASFIMIFKKGDPISFLFGGISALLGGVFFPITVFPAWLKTIAMCLPITYALHGMRLAVLQNYGPSMIKTDLVAMAIFTFLMLPTGLAFFRYALNKAKQDGSLHQY